MPESNLNRTDAMCKDGSFQSRVAGSLIDILHHKGIANDDRQELIKALSLFEERGLDIVDCILCAKQLFPATIYSTSMPT
ncbi:MAG TPA: hypothetical protein VMB78_03265 [Dissulfurispiraceae bacterium]|nr:hypothetical protein [Dissulfurispiraceae bacterium]